MVRGATLVVLPIVLVAAVVAALVHDEPGPGPVQARVEVTGRAVVVAESGRSRVITADGVVAFGDRLVVEQGSAVVKLASGARYELRRRGDRGSELVVERRPRLLAGDALVGGELPAWVRVGTATLRTRGPVKVDADADAASVYAGASGVSGVGDVAEVPALRRLVLVPGARLEPVPFDGTDPWDRRHLGEAIAFGERLEALARGYTRDLRPGGGLTEGFLRGVLPALDAEREFGADLLDPARPPGETLVGAAIAVQGRRGAFRERWEQVFAFRSAGAAWGIVALDQGVSSAPVLEAIELAVAAPRPGAVAPGDPRAGRPADPAPASPAPVAPDPAPPVVPPPAPAAPDPAAPEPAPGLLSPVLEPVSELVDGLLGSLLGGG